MREICLRVRVWPSKKKTELEFGTMKLKRGMVNLRCLSALLP